jgi:hypothetical protein
MTTVLTNKERIYSFYSREESTIVRGDLPGLSHSTAVGDRAGYTLRQDGTVYHWGYNHQNFLTKGEENHL